MNIFLQKKLKKIQQNKNRNKKENKKKIFNWRIIWVDLIAIIKFRHLMRLRINSQIVAIKSLLPLKKDKYYYLSLKCKSLELLMVILVTFTVTKEPPTISNNFSNNRFVKSPSF